MAEYIERRATIHRIRKMASMIGFENPAVAIDCAVKCMERSPAANVAPVVHGDWTMDGKNHCHCSICAFGRNIETQIGWHYCPNCGAKMKDGE